MSNNLHQILQEYCPFRIGDYVIVNIRDYGLIITIKNNNVEITVKYAITNVIQDISVYDCQIASIINNTNIRPGLEHHVRTALQYFQTTEQEDYFHQLKGYLLIQFKNRN